MKNKIISFVLVLTLLLLLLTSSNMVFADELSSYILGDVDGDGSVTIVDATCIQKKIALFPVQPYVTEAADVDEDKVVSIVDTTIIQKWLASISVPCRVGQTITIQTPTNPDHANSKFIVNSVTASPGETVDVVVEISNNPGILGMTLSLQYDNNALTLINANSGSAMSNNLMFTRPGKYSNPCNFTWDGVELDSSQIKDGEILVLTFKVSSDAKNDVYPIKISYEEDSIFNADLKPVNVDIVNGSITVGNDITEPTAIEEPTQEITEPTEAVITGPTFIVKDVTTSLGSTVNVIIDVKNNPGILGMTLKLSYDNSVMTLTNAASGSAVSDVLAFTKPGKFTSPCNFTWDGLEIDSSQIKDGDILMLTFDINNSVAAGKYPINISYEEDCIIGADLTPVDFAIVNGSVTVK